MRSGHLADWQKGLKALTDHRHHVFTPGQGSVVPDDIQIQGLQSPEAAALLGADLVAELTDEIELVQGASHEFDLDEYRRGELTPVFFGTALANFGVREMLNYFVEWAPAAGAGNGCVRYRRPKKKFSGFIF